MYSDNTEVNVLITETNDNLSIEVISHGNTISEDEQAKLFEAFTRGNNAQNIAGSGLGLRIVKRILEYHDADIVYSSPEEYMNKFTLFFKNKMKSN